MTNILDINKILNEFNDFFDHENISRTNKDIMLAYIDSMFIAIPRLSPGTIRSNADIMKFVLRHIKTDLDKLTNRDIITCKRVMLEWKRTNGKPIAESTKVQYLVGLKRFMKWYEEEVDENCGYSKLSKQIKTKNLKSNKIPSDLLTVEEIERMIMTADGDRDKAIISVLADSGCRIGEILSCRIKDVKFLDDGCRLTFPKGKTGSRTVLLQFASIYVNRWLRVHPQNDNPDAPLWITKKKKNIGSKEDKKLESNAIEYHSMYSVIKRTAERADIKKRIHPHLFRHTAATRISKKMSESAMKQFLGWTSNSSMPSTYIHLSGEDIDNAVRAMNGTIKVEKKDEGGLKVIECIRCNTVVPAGAMYCLRCGLPLTIDAKNADNTLNQALATLFAQNPEMQANLMKNILNLAQK